MIKRVMLLLALAIGVPAYADMYFDVTEKMCKTYPESPEINQEEYNELAQHLYMDLKEVWNNYGNTYTTDSLWRLACINIKKKVSTIKTETAKRFIADIDLIPNIYAYNNMLGLR